MAKLLPRQCGRGSITNCSDTLRDQLYQEIEHKAKSCAMMECTIPRIEGYDYCIRHILRDPKGNYRQCTYTYPNGKKCLNALPKHDVKKDPNMTTLCFEHNRQVQLQKTHATVGKLKQVDTNEALLNSLAHHINIEEVLDTKRKGNCEQDEEIDVVSPHATPFVSYDQIHNLNDIATALVKKRRRILDFASDSSSSEEEIICMSNTSRGHECNESDNESVDSQDDDVLKHAGIYTRQEAIRISETKLTKLQGLYIDQINRLHHILREKRRRYLHAIRREREHLCSIHEQLKETPRERALYEQLKSLNSYHRRHGIEAVLYKKFKEKRNRAGETYGPKNSGFTKCMYTEGGVKCSERSLPCCKYCRRHILEDKKQILFKACEKERSGIVCKEPIPAIFDDSTCVLHLTMPNQRQYVQKKYESETEEEEIEVKVESIVDIKSSPKTISNASNYNTSNNITISHESQSSENKSDVKPMLT